MTSFSYQGFGANSAGRARIERIIRELQKTEVGRLFLSNLPPNVTFRYKEGDQFTRASADTWHDTITVPQNTFDSGFGAYQTIIHELAHLLQRVPQLDFDIKGLLEGIHGVLVKHQKDRRFAWVTAPLKRLMTEETLAQDIVGLIFRLGYGRAYNDHYYITGDETVPPKGTLHPSLSANDRLLFMGVMRKLQTQKLSGGELRSNFQAFEEFYQRAMSANWIGIDDETKARFARERARRSVQATGS